MPFPLRRPAPEPPVATFADLAAGEATVRAEHDALAVEITAATARHTALAAELVAIGVQHDEGYLGTADDAALTALRDRKRGVEREMARIAARVAQGTRDLRVLATEVRKFTYTRHVRGYGEAASRAIAKAVELQALLAELAQARGAAVRDGFTGPDLNALPTPPPTLDVAEWTTYATHIEAHLAGGLVAPPTTPILPPSATVRFLRGHRSYQRGDVAGFLPGEAWQLVDAGLAEWFAGSPIPSRPARPPAPVPTPTLAAAE